MPVRWDTKDNLVTCFNSGKAAPKKTKASNSHQYFWRELELEQMKKNNYCNSLKLERKLSHRDPVVAHLTNTFQDLQVLLGNTVFFCIFFVCLFCLCNPRRTAQFYPLDQFLRVPYLGYSLRCCFCRQIILLRFSITFSDSQLDIQDHRTLNENLNHCTALERAIRRMPRCKWISCFM